MSTQIYSRVCIVYDLKEEPTTRTQWPRTVRERVDIQVMSPIYFHQNFPLESPPRLGPSPFVSGVPKRLFWGTKKREKHSRTLPEGVLIDSQVFHSSVYSKRHTLRTEQGLGDRQSFFVIYDFKGGFPGFLVSTESRKMCSVSQKLRRDLSHIICCVLTDGIWSHSFLKSTKSTCTELSGSGGLGVVFRSPVNP